MKSETDIRDLVLKSLTEDYGYSIDQIGIEVAFIDDEGRRRRADLIIYESAEKRKPLILVEIKNRLLLPAMITQLEEYMLRVNTEFGFLTDGSQSYTLRVSESGDLVPIPDIPRNGEKELDFPLKDRLQAGREIIFIFWSLADTIRGFKRELNMLEEISKLLLCKLTDEKDPSDRVQFWITESEQNYENETRNFLDRIQNLLKRAIDAFGPEFADYGVFRLEPPVLKQCVRLLQSYSISRNPEIVFSAYRGFVKKILSESIRTRYFHTPEEITTLIIELLSPSPELTFLDPACGTGEILDAIIQYRGVVKDNATHIIYGVERVIDSIFIAKTLLALVDIDGTSIHVGDILVRNQAIDKIALSIKGFDRIGTAPPWSHVTNETIMEQYQVAQDRSRMEYPGLIIERCHSLLAPSGRLAILVPEGLLFRSSERKVREYIREKYELKAIISFPSGILRPYTGVKASLLVLEKPKGAPKEEYPVFIATLSEMESLPIESRFEKVLSGFRRFEKGRKKLFPGIRVVNMSEIEVDNWSVEQMNLKLAVVETEGTPLSEICDIFSGVSVSSRHYIDDSLKGVPYIRVGDLADATVMSEGFKHIPDDKAPSRKKLLPGDVLFSIKGTIGKLAVTPSNHQGSIPGSQIVVLRPKSKKTRPEYLVQVLSSSKMRKLLERLTTGAYIPHLKISLLRQLNVPHPPPEEQDSLLHQIGSLKEELSKLEHKSRRIEKEIHRLQEGVWDGA